MRATTRRGMETTRGTRDTSRRGREIKTKEVVLEGEAMATSTSRRVAEDKTTIKGVASLIITEEAIEVTIKCKITEEDMTSSRIKIKDTEEAILD